MDRGRTLIAGLLLVALIGLLSIGLRDAQFRAGRFGRIPPVEEQVAPLEEHIPPPAPWAEAFFRILAWVFIGGGGLGLIVALVRKEHRKHVLASLVGAALAVLLVMVAGDLFHWWYESDEQIPQVQENDDVVGLPPGDRPPEVGESPPPGAAEPPAAAGWTVYVTAVGAAALLGAGGLYLWGRWGARLAKRREESETEELLKAAQDAAEELRRGLPVEEVVIRCWERMVELLMPYAEADSRLHAVTPRELASLLRRRGVDHRAVHELTSLFEEVRYGHMDAAPRRERALEALAAVEEAYGAA